ncbi:D-alanyl-D-alanine carboxypeptidase family protein [Acidithiobacillus sp. IBUN Pt1247-S3]|uniref:D-alanyl-D-alanine carboxypeptidase family protein n=1 Tax=Acidithiobacillus sp. IBUN Pt1247-S3 TaxID=3166642 RepID=UPI0034E4CFC3
MAPAQKKIRNLLYLLFFSLSCLLGLETQAQAQDVSSLPPIDARSYILINAETGQILAAKNAYKPYAIASLSKLMTLYLLFQDINAGHLQLHGQYTPCPAALQTGGSSMFLRAGLPFSLAQLILGMTVPSGNDAAVEAAVMVGGTVPNFVQSMNTTAKGLGMLSTTYNNPDGLPHPNNFSSAYDQAVLTRNIMQRFPNFMHFFNHENFTYAGITNPNPNLLVGRVPFVTGMKSGYTDAAGHCLVVTGTQGNVKLIAVVLGVPSFTDEGRGFWKASWAGLKLLDWGFARTLWLPSAGLENTAVEQ